MYKLTLVNALILLEMLSTLVYEEININVIHSVKVLLIVQILQLHIFVKIKCTIECHKYNISLI